MAQKKFVEFMYDATPRGLDMCWVHLENFSPAHAYVCEKACVQVLWLVLAGRGTVLDFGGCCTSDRELECDGDWSA